MTLNNMTDDTDLNAPLTNRERLAQIEISILALEKEVARKVELATERHNAYYAALTLSIEAEEEVVMAQEALKGEKDKLEELKAVIKAEKENQPIVTIDEMEERLEIKKGGYDIRKENHLETAREIKLWMIEEPLNAEIVLSILQNVPLDADFFRSQDTDNTTVRNKYSHLVRLIDTAGHRRIKTIRDRLIFILRTKDSEY